MSEEKDKMITEDDAALLEEDDSLSEENSEAEQAEADSAELSEEAIPEAVEEPQRDLPKLEANESQEAKPVQLSLDPSISMEEEQEEAAGEHRIRQKAILEGLLFLTGDEGLTIEQAAKTMDLKKSEVESLFDELQEYYTSDERGFEIERYGETYRFLSKAIVHDAAKKLFQINKQAKLSNAALETLAIIAYKQPVTRVEIEEIRGVGADVMLRKLEARGLIKEDGRSDAPGRPILYSVTDEFMDAFSLMSLDELPDLPEFHTDGDKDEDGDLFNQ
jgi:segregation and condensation protein B